MNIKKLWWLLPLACLAACDNAGNHEKYLSKTDSSVTRPLEDTLGSSLGLTSPERKIIRTADFNCKVQNVFTAVNGLENLVKSVGGMVQDSHIENSSNEPQTIEYKPDSLKRTQVYTTTARLTLRVPSDCIDSVVQNIPAMVTFIDSRTLSQNDVTAHFLGNQLKNAIGTKVYTPGKGVQLAKNTEDLVQLQEYEDNKQAQLVNRKVENMLLLDDVHYATITVALSQPQQVLVQTIINPDYFTRVPFILQFQSALRSGWEGILEVLVAFMSIWPLLILSVIGWKVYRFWLKNRRLHSKPSPDAYKITA